MDKVERAFLETREYKRALELYRRSDGEPKWGEGVLGEFANEMFVESEGSSVKASRIRELYEEWASLNGKPSIGPRELGMMLRAMLEAKRMSDGIYYLGIKESKSIKTVYRLYSKETDETNGEYYDMAGVVEFIQDYWMLKNKGQELPDKLENPTINEIRSELDDFGIYAKTKNDRFGFFTI